MVDAFGGSMTVERQKRFCSNLLAFFVEIKRRIICTDINTHTSAVLRPWCQTFRWRISSGCALIAVLNKTLRQHRRAPNTQSSRFPAPLAPSESWPLMMIYGSLRCLSKPDAGLIKYCMRAELLPRLLRDTCGVIIHLSNAMRCVVFLSKSSWILPSKPF